MLTYTKGHFSTDAVVGVPTTVILPSVRHGGNLGRNPGSGSLQGLRGLAPLSGPCPRLQVVADMMGQISGQLSPNRK